MSGTRTAVSARNRSCSSSSLSSPPLSPLCRYRCTLLHPCPGRSVLSVSPPWRVPFTHSQEGIQDLTDAPQPRGKRSLFAPPSTITTPLNYKVSSSDLSGKATLSPAPRRTTSSLRRQSASLFSSLSSSLVFGSTSPSPRAHTKRASCPLRAPPTPAYSPRTSLPLVPPSQPVLPVTIDKQPACSFSGPLRLLTASIPLASLRRLDTSPRRSCLASSFFFSSSFHGGASAPHSANFRMGGPLSVDPCLPSAFLFASSLQAPSLASADRLSSSSSSPLSPTFCFHSSSPSHRPRLGRLLFYRSRLLSSYAPRLREEESHGTFSVSTSTSPSSSSSSSRFFCQGAGSVSTGSSGSQLERMASLILTYVDGSPSVPSDGDGGRQEETEEGSIPSLQGGGKEKRESKNLHSSAGGTRSTRGGGGGGGRGEGGGYLSPLTEGVFPPSLVESLREFRDVCAERNVLTSLLCEEGEATSREEEDEARDDKTKATNRRYSDSYSRGSVGWKKRECEEEGGGGARGRNEGRQMQPQRSASKGRRDGIEEDEKEGEEEDADTTEDGGGETGEEDLPQCLVNDPDWRDLHEKARRMGDSLLEDLLLHRVSIHRGLRHLSSPAPSTLADSSCTKGGSGSEKGHPSERTEEEEDEFEGDAVLEVQAGVGGEDAALFSRDLFCMYEVFASSQGWKWRVLDLIQTDRGGYRRATAEIEGRGAYGLFCLEAGVHRVQRVPPTETRGRMQTSASAVSVLPRSKNLEKKVDLSPSNLKVEFMRSSGPGGQSVNKSETAVRLTHKPTGISVHCMQTQSQTENKNLAMAALRDRLLQRLILQESQQREAKQGAQMGTKDRSQKIRTYNFQRDVVIDHRCKRQVQGVEMFLKTSAGLEDFHDVLRKRREKALIADLLSSIERTISTALKITDSAEERKA